LRGNAGASTSLYVAVPTDADPGDWITEPVGSIGSTSNNRAMGAGGTVVGPEARRRWALVAAILAVLCALPVIIRVWPVQAAGVDAATLRARATASATKPYQGYAQSIGTLGLPDLPQLSDVTSLLSTTTELRTWYAAPDRWRVDQIGPGQEQDLYARPDGEYRWDYTDEQLVRVVGAQPVRLPRAADLTPPELGRRLLDATAADPVTKLPDRRIAGTATAGLRVLPADPDTTIAHIDIWAVPESGLPLQVEVTARGVDRPVLTSRFLEIDQHAPAEDVITPPARHAGIGYTTTDTPDLVSAINRFSRAELPGTLGGLPRRTALAGVSAAGIYGSGLTELVVLAAPGRIGRDAYDTIAKYGTAVDYPGDDDEATIISTSLLSVLVVRNRDVHQTYLVAGFVKPAVLRSAGTELAEGAG
jgi:hypothetical protein